MQSPKGFKACKGCTERHRACHDHCKRYKDERDEWEARKAAADEERKVRQYILGTYYKHAGKKSIDRKNKKQYKHL